MTSAILKNLELSNQQTFSDVTDIIAMLNEKSPKHKDILDKKIKPMKQREPRQLYGLMKNIEDDEQPNIISAAQI